MVCPICDETNSPRTIVWCEQVQDFVYEDCWRPGTFVWWGS
jgi:hypothetical protein